MLPLTMNVRAQQLTNANFEDWSGDKFDGNIQPKGWHASNVEQLGYKFNFAHQEAGHNKGYCMMVQDQDVGVGTITETSPGYFSLGQPWVYIKDLFSVSEATAGTAGSINFKYRPDSMVVWIKRTGNNTDKEDFYLLYYSWKGTAVGNQYKGKNGKCTSVTKTDEESDVRLELDGNECGTATKATQVAEGMIRQKKSYNNWTRMVVPIYYFNNEVPDKMNIIFSASNYPNFRANNGLYAGNSLYVDDVELIYSSKIQKLFVGGKEWKAFDPNNTGVQTYSLGETATSIPAITARRGIGSITNARGKTVPFNGRELSSSEMTIEYGDLDSKPTKITVKSEDGKSTTVYQIQFQRAPSTNATLAEVQINGEILSSFRPGQTKYDVELPYGTTKAPVVTYTLAEDGQTAVVTQATSTTGTATIKVTAADKTTSKTYTFNFSVGKLKDVTLKDILVNGKSIPGFTPAQAVYKVSLPTSTSAVPDVKPVSAYPEGEQTIKVTLPTFAQIQAGNGQAQISVSAPGATGEKIYKLNFKIEASSYSRLTDLQVVGEQVESINPSKLDDPTALAFDPDMTSYYITLKMGSRNLPKILWTPGDEYQTITLDTSKVSNGNGAASVNVMAGNGLDQTVYKLVFDAPKSTNVNLAGVLINGKQMEGFDPEVTNYRDTLNIGEDFPTVEPIPGDEYQTFTKTTRVVGNASTTSITVMAGNGNSKTYNFTFVSQTYTDNRLADLSVEGYSLLNKNGEAVSFNPDVKEYWVKLTMGTETLPKINVTLRDPQYQDTVQTFPTSLNGNYSIVVTPLNGASRTYYIRFSVEVSKNAALKMIYLDAEPLPGFAPDVRSYIYTVEQGNNVPEVTWEVSEAVQTVDTITKKNTKYLTVTAGDKKTKREYSIRFKFPASNNTQLLDIKLKYPGKDTISMKEKYGFRGDSLDYTLELNGVTCPEIFPKTTAGQKVAVAAPYADGTAIIKVVSEDGLEETTYTIEFTKAIAESVQLDMIYVNGLTSYLSPAFQASQPHYTATYTGSLPTITWLPADADAQLLWKNTADESTAYIRVRDDQGNEATYDIVFTEIVSVNSVLLGIYADNVLIDGFDAAKKTYVFDLPAGQNYPEISYQVAESAQVVFFGQLAEGKWGITVQAANSDTAMYTVQYLPAKFNDATLENLQVTGDLISYNPAVTEYGPFNIDEGLPLPQVTATPKADKNQKVLIFTVNDNEQQVLVVAENGTDSTLYKITYTRVKSSIALLESLFIDGEKLLTFRPDSFNYTIELPQGAKVVPNVYPVGKLANQVITTTFGKPNETTTILVEAQDGITKQTYTIDFPVFVSGNNKLKSLYIDGEDKDVNETDYVFPVPFGTTVPYDVEFEKGEEAQHIQYIDAPITGVTKIIVTAENGDKRTYSIRYTIKQPEGENKVNKVSYTYTNAAGESVDGSLVPVKGNNIVELPFGATSFSVTDIEKSYPEQSIVFFNGDIRRGAKIIAVANRQGVNDVTYIITPHMPEFDATGKLQSLKYKVGDEFVDVPNFRPDVYNYMIDVTAQPTIDDIQAVAYDSKSVDFSAFDDIKKQVILTVSGGETYSICWFYKNDGKYLKSGQYYDYFDFSQDWPATPAAPMWKATMTSSASQTGTTKSTGIKPYGWTVPADLVAGFEYSISMTFFGKEYHIVDLFWYTGKEVIAAGTNGAMLSTINGASINGSVPGMMTLGGTMSLTPNKSGGSSSDITYNTAKFINFRNTPDSLSMGYKSLHAERVTGWYYELKTVAGGATRTDKFPGDYSSKEWRYASKPISPYSGAMSKFALTINSTTTTNAGDMAGSDDIYTSDLQIENLHFVYNSKLTEAFINGSTTPIELGADGRTFLYNVPDGVEIIGRPALKFTGVVHDQMQVIEWLNNGEWIDGNLTARVINYGENSQDSTHYYVVLHRDPQESLAYTADFESLTSTAKDDTTFVNLPFARTKFPELKITPDNIHQRFDITKEGDAVTVIVINEKNVADTMVYVFRQNLSKTAAPENIIATNKKDDVVPFKEGAFAPTVFDYTVEAEEMPTISVTKAGFSDNNPLNQTVDIKQTADSAVVIITAEDGVTAQTYTIRLERPVVVTNGQISSFKQDDIEWDNLGLEKYFAEADKPTSPVLFTRTFDSDAVVFIQTQDSMEWDVTGNESHAYVLKYPTDKSTNARLADILVAGQSMSGFNPDNTDLPYTVYTDTTLVIEAVPAEPVQTIVTELTPIEGGVEYTCTVTAEDGVATKTYTIQMVHSMSDIATLAGIYLDSVLITGFAPDVTAYNVTLSIPKGPKTAHVKMPNITYAAGDKGQKIEMTPGALNAEATTIAVTNEIGSLTKQYTVKIDEEKSSCTELTGITVNGKFIGDPFEPGRHFYSTSVEKDDITLGYTCDDRFFQSVQIIINPVKPGHEYSDTLRVTAEDGTQADYVVEIYVQNQSNDAQLANILLDHMDFISYKDSLANSSYNIQNPKLKAFDPGQNEYHINAPSEKIPSVNAQLKMDGQKVESTIESTDQIYCVHLNVTAVDGVTKNEYKVYIEKTLPQKNRLLSISIDGDTIKPFNPDKHSYIYDKLPDGSSLPTEDMIGYETEDEAIQGDPNYVQINRFEADNLITIVVHAQDPNYPTAEYNVTFIFRKDSTNTLETINETRNGITQPVNGWDPEGRFFHTDLPIGEEFPEISYGDDRYPGDGLWPSIDSATIAVDTVNNLTWQHQTIVTAQDGSSRTYIVSYRKLQSDVTTLQTIKVSKDGGKTYQVVDGWNPEKTEYYYELTDKEATALNGELPKIQPVEGDEYQLIDTLTAVDSLSRKSLHYKHVINVTAATGRTRTYTVHYPVKLSTDATLNMIKYKSGGVLEDFVSTRENYKIQIEAEAELPMLIPVKNHEKQRCDLDTLAGIDTIRYFVWAEDTTYKMTYTIAFERILSAKTILEDITLKDTLTHKPLYDLFEFKSDEFDYTIQLPYDSLNRDVLPEITPKKADPKQEVTRFDNAVENGVDVTLHVKAPNGEDEADYVLRFRFTRNNDADLKMICFVRGDTIEVPGFKPAKLDYTYKHPFGSDSTAFFTEKEILIVKSDSLAEAKIEMVNGVIEITVTAQDGKSVNTYNIRQVIGQDTVNTLDMIYLDDVELPNFRPDSMFYIFYLMNGAGATPFVTGIPTSPNADTTYLRKEVNDTTLIFCTAQDGTDRIYRILFKESDINDGIIATSSNEVFIRRVKGANQLFVSTIRSGVFFYLYDRNGHLVYQYENLPTANPNNVEVEKDGWDNDILLNVEPDPNSGIYVDIIPQQVYFYSFVSAKKKIASGKLIAIPAK
ncbi:MAG: hypothetical protein IKT13_03730 [Paludibacteraceae bacterium]|nr:hypothetical protein [Paludibacteraceae bacterium]